MDTIDEIEILENKLLEQGFTKERIDELYDVFKDVLENGTDKYANELKELEKWEWI